MSAVKREPIKVAVIEDTPALGKLVQRIVDSMDGIQTFGVWENAEDGLKAIENGGPDVVLMDISLPGMSGIEATARVKEKHPVRGSRILPQRSRLSRLPREQGAWCQSPAAPHSAHLDRLSVPGKLRGQSCRPLL